MSLLEEHLILKKHEIYRSPHGCVYRSGLLPEIRWGIPVPCAKSAHPHLTYMGELLQLLDETTLVCLLLETITMKSISFIFRSTSLQAAG